MEGLVRLVSFSVRGFVRWTDIMFWPRGLEFGRALAPAGVHLPYPEPPAGEMEEDETDGKWEGFLWAAPKKRTTRMKRLRRKFGHQDWGNSLHKLKTNLRVCDTCGHHYEANHLCRTCYEKVMAETDLIRKSISDKVGHSAEDASVVVLYESEKDQLNSNESLVQKVKNKMIVEIAKPRPTWFSSNLLQRSTAGVNTETKTVAVQPPKPVTSESQ